MRGSAEDAAVAAHQGVAATISIRGTKEILFSMSVTPANSVRDSRSDAVSCLEPLFYLLISAMIAVSRSFVPSSLCTHKLMVAP